MGTRLDPASRAVYDACFCGKPGPYALGNEEGVARKGTTLGGYVSYQLASQMSESPAARRTFHAEGVKDPRIAPLQAPTAPNGISQHQQLHEVCNAQRRAADFGRPAVVADEGMGPHGSILGPEDFPFDKLRCGRRRALRSPSASPGSRRRPSAQAPAEQPLLGAIRPSAASGRVLPLSQARQPPGARIRYTRVLVSKFRLAALSRCMQRDRTGIRRLVSCPRRPPALRVFISAKFAAARPGRFRTCSR